MNWEEKIEILVKLAKATGRYLNSQTGTDYNAEAMFNLREAYEEFCEWRHEEPYVVDEIKALLEKTPGQKYPVPGQPPATGQATIQHSQQGG